MDKGKRDKVKVGVKTINQLLESRKETKRYSSIASGRKNYQIVFI